jgi:KDO2-lipid IV(A) lauroyltransferase
MSGIGAFRSAVGDGVVYAGVRGAVAATQVAGVNDSMRAMRALGGRFARLPFNRERLARARANLGWCFPEWSAERVEACAVESYRHLFSLAVEVGAAPRLLAGDAYAEYAEFGDLERGLRELLRDRPAVLVTGHTGNWEILGMVLAVLGVHINAVYRPLDMKPLDRWVRRTRGARGMTLIDKFGAAQQIPRLMESGEAVAFVADQNAGIRGLFVPYFDRMASAYKAIGVSAMRYGAPVICGQAVRLTGGEEADISVSGVGGVSGAPSQLFRYRLEVEDVILPEEWGSQPDPLFYITARYRRAIESMVRRNPEQYLWMHRYWKSRPRHERRREAFPERLLEKVRSLPWMTEERVRRIVERSEVDAEENARREAARAARRAGRSSSG